MKFAYSSGGRERYFKGMANDCVTRAIANATDLDYKVIYNGLHLYMKKKSVGKGKLGSPRNGVQRHVAKEFVTDILGWVWTPCMGIGTGCQVHIREDELPKDTTMILNLSSHMSCVRDGLLFDTFDCSREGKRCVYGYWTAPKGWTRDVFNQNMLEFERKQASKAK